MGPKRSHHTARRDKPNKAQGSRSTLLDEFWPLQLTTCTQQIYICARSLKYGRYEPMRLKSITLDKAITYLRWPVVIFGVIYFSCMIAVPLFMRDWRDVQEVWDRWQGFNVGVLAFGASFIAFEITRYNESRQRKRDFLAARAFLPEALSELTTYLNGSAAVLMTAWNGTPQVGIPPVPLQYRDVFSNCIRHADSSTGEKLADILVWLQVHTARLQLFLANPARTQAMMRINVLENLRLVGELQAKV